MYEGLKHPIEEYLVSITHNTDGNCRQYNNNQKLNTCFTAANVSIIIINVIIFILTDFLSFPANGIPFIDKGSLSWDMVINHHQYYRIITSMFLHLDHHIFLIICLYYYLLEVILNSILGEFDALLSIFYQVLLQGVPQ